MVGVVHYEDPHSRALACRPEVRECDRSTHDPLDVTCPFCIAELVRRAAAVQDCVHGCGASPVNRVAA